MNLLLPAIGAGLGLLSSKSGGTWKGLGSPSSVKYALIGAALGVAVTYLAKSGSISQNTDQLKYIIPDYRQPHLRSMGPQFDAFGNPDRVAYH